MSDFKKAIILALSDLAKEINDMEADAERYAERRINKNDVLSLISLVHYRAHTHNTKPFIVRLALETHMGVDDLEEIKSSKFREAVEYLVNWQGVN